MQTQTRITADTITDEQIRALRTEAATASDFNQISICDLALGTNFDDGISWGGGDTTQEEALAECARVIADAAAQS